MRMVRRIALKFAVGALACAMVGIGGQLPAQAAPTSLTVGVGITAGTFGPWIVMKEQGFAEENGIDLSVRVFEQGSIALEALLAGQLDLTSTSLATVIPPSSRGSEIAVLALIGSSHGVYGAVAGPEITAPADLTKEGVVVGRPEGTSPYFLAQYLKLHNIDPDDVNIRNVDTASLLPALTRGDIQAFFAHEPHVRISLRSLPDAKVLALGGDVGFVDSTTVVASAKVAADNEASVALMKAFVSTIAWMKENPDKAAELIAKHFKFPLEDVVQDLALYDYDVRFRAESVELMKDMGDWLLAEGRITQLPDWSVLLRPEALKSVAPDAVDF